MRSARLWHVRRAVFVAIPLSSRQIPSTGLPGLQRAKTVPARRFASDRVGYRKDMNEETNDPQNEQDQSQTQAGEREPSRPEDDLDKDPAYNPDDEGLKGIKGG